MSLRLGDVAPNFTANTTEGTIDFHQWLGKSWGVLFSHPADYTPVCTTELGAVAKIKAEFQKRDVKVMAVSVDPLDSHHGWIKDINETQACTMNFPIIADEKRQVASAYDMIHPNADDKAISRDKNAQNRDGLSQGRAGAAVMCGPVTRDFLPMRDSASNSFTFTGSGTIAGPGGLVKEGSSLLTIDSPDSLLGPVTINAGAIYAGNNCFATASSITITNNSTLDLAGSTFTGNTPVTVSGTGLNGEGAIYNSSNNYPQEALNITMAGDTTFGGSARWDLASGSEIAGPHNLTVDWSAGAGDGQWNSVVIGANVADVLVTNGSTLGFSYMDTSCQNSGTMFTIGPGSQLVFYNGGFNGSISVAESAIVTSFNGGVAFSGNAIHLFGGAKLYLYGAGVAVNGNNLFLENNALWASYYNSGVNTISSAVTLNGVAHFVLGDHEMVYTNVISGPGGFLLDYYNNEVVLSATNTYTGPTIIGSSGNNPEVALTGNGSISQSALIFFGGTNAGVAHLDVSGRSDQTLTLAIGQTLAGIGTIHGKVMISLGATLSPAGTNTTIGITAGANSTGTIAASGSIALNGSTVIKLNGSGVNDEVESGAGITFGGTLRLININGTPLAIGNRFQVFVAASYAGSFANIDR